MSSVKNYIEKHKSYIDRRIAIISEDINADNAIEYLITSNEKCNNIVNDNDISEALNELKDLLNRWNIIEDGDIAGYIYQNLEGKSHQKKKGQFFTPGKIVDSICQSAIKDKCKNYSDIKILDPSCGSGQFLINAFNYLMELYLKEGISFKEAAEIIISTQIYGFDIDSTVIEIAKYNLEKISGISKEKINISNDDFLYKDDLKLLNNQINLKYDIIIGNPPWGCSITPERKQYFNRQYYSSKSGINSFTLFLERSFDYITHDGIISFLLPEAYLNIKAHSASREFILDRAMIRRITLWGEQFKNVFSPSISIEIKSEENLKSRSSNIVKISRGLMDYETLVPQESFRTGYESIFNINYSRKAVNIISLMNEQNISYLKNRSTFFLGIVTGNNSKYISSSQSDEYPDPILIGQDLKQYKIKFSNHYFKFNPETLQQTAPMDLYKNSNKILYKFIGKKLTFAKDNTGIYSLNNINGFISGIETLNNESIISILNSKAMQYYYEKSFFTVKVLKGNLERLPLKKISRENQKKIKILVDELIYNEDNPALRENIEDIIFYEYGLKDREINYIVENYPL